MTSSFRIENTILNFAYALIDFFKDSSAKRIAKKIAPAVAFTYVLGIYAGEIFHKVRHHVEDHLSLGDLS